MSGDPEQEYFADGMVEDIITAGDCRKPQLVHRLAAARLEQRFPRPTRACHRAIPLRNAAQSARSRNLSCGGRTDVCQLLSASFRGCFILGYQIAGPSKELSPGHELCGGKLRNAGPYCRCSDHA